MWTESYDSREEKIDELCEYLSTFSWDNLDDLARIIVDRLERGKDD
jgi:hypothetical protein